MYIYETKALETETNSQKYKEKKWLFPPGISHKKGITTAGTRFIIASDGIAVCLNYEMVPLCTHGITTPS